MKTDRRGFFRILGGTLAVLFGRPTRARAREEALEVHQANRNQLLGALGAGHMHSSGGVILASTCVVFRRELQLSGCLGVDCGAIIRGKQAFEEAHDVRL